MNNASELNTSHEKICRLCAIQQVDGEELFVVGSEELDKLVMSTCCLLDIECKNDGTLPKWMCSRCKVEATRMEEFILLVKTGQAKLKELLSSWNDGMKSDLIKTDAFITQTQSILEAEKLQDIEEKTKTYRKKVKQNQKADCIEQHSNELVLHNKRLRRRPQRLLEEIQLKGTSKKLSSPLPVKIENEIDPCALITSHPIAELRTAAGNSLGEIVEIESNKEKENLFSAKTYFICEYCKAVFRRQNAFLKHIETHKKCIYECHECLQTFSNKNCFSQHQTLTGHIGVGIIEYMAAQNERVHLNKDYSRLGAAAGTAAINIVVGANGQITSIDQMGHSVVDKAVDSQAQTKEAPDGVLPTEDCVKISYNGFAKKLSNPKKYACLLCPKTFDFPYSVRRHYRLVHVAERKHKCSQCPAAFKTKYNYNLHLATHTGEKNFTCNICTKPFITKHEWKVHNRVHTGEKPFQCSVCLKTFANRCNLVTHKRVHTGEHKQVHLKAAQRKLKLEQNAGTTQKQYTSMDRDSNLHKNVDATQALITLNSIKGIPNKRSILKPLIADKPISLLKPYHTDTKFIENSELPSMKNVQILPTIVTDVDSNHLSTICTKSLQSQVLSSELPNITNVQILPSIAPYPEYNDLKTNSFIVHSSSSNVTKNLTLFTPTDANRSQFKFFCPSCPKQFKQSSALTKHQRTHTGERPYKCPMCPKSYADPSNFKKHRMLHKNATNALKNVNTSMSSTMQELRQMLEEQSITITSHAAQRSTYADSDPDPDGLENYSSSLPCPSDFTNVDETLNEHNSSFTTAALDNFIPWNRSDNALQAVDAAAINSLVPFTNIADVDRTVSVTANTNKLVYISQEDPNNPTGKKTTTHWDALIKRVEGSELNLTRVYSGRYE